MKEGWGGAEGEQEPSSSCSVLASSSSCLERGGEKWGEESRGRNGVGKIGARRKEGRVEGGEGGLFPEKNEVSG